MIGKGCKYFCIEDLCLIENYDKAINDTTQTWDCHHRLEIELNLSARELKERGLYFNRPASELIFLTKSEHRKIHSFGGWYNSKGKNNPMYGKNSEDYMSEEAIKEKRKKQSKNLTGEKNGRHNTKQMYKDGVYETVKYKKIDEYLSNGWIIKGRPWRKKLLF